MKGVTLKFVVKGVGAIFDKADLRGAQITDSFLTHSSWVGTNLRETAMEDMRLMGSSFVGTDMSGTKLVDARMQNSTITHTSFVGANLAGPCDLSGAAIHNSSFRGAFLSGVRLIGVSAQGVDFGSAYLGLADLKYAELQNTTFRAATVTDARFDHANVSGADFTDSVGLEKAWFGKVVGSPRLGGYSVVIGPGPKWSVSKMTALVGATPTAIPIAG
mmetsp:Transcript_15199/g.50512  ORF Transcript_15199/g.50512 Transcript_15199/m.50512 type:complete len:217 (-) Transcript_15199:139-789(-)